MPFLLVSSFAFLAASLACADSSIFVKINLVSLGFSSNHCSRPELTAVSTTGLISDDTNLCLV